MACMRMFGQFTKGEPFHILIWFLAIIISLYCIISSVAGNNVLLSRAQTVQPYAKCYVTPDCLKRGNRPDKLIFFFGDSTIEGLEADDDVGSAELLQSDLENRLPDLGKVSVVRWSFGSATLFHFYCMMFLSQKYNPDLLIIPVNWFWFGSRTPIGWWHGSAHLHMAAGMVPFTEYLSNKEANPLRQSGITPADKFIYLLDRERLISIGMKLWIRDELHLPRLLDYTDTRWRWFGEGAGFINLCSDDSPLELLRYFAETAEELNVRIIFYIVPVSSSMRVKSEVRDPSLFKCSAERIVQACTTQTTTCLDLSQLLSSNQFYDSLHYNLDGQKQVERALVPEIYQEFFPESNKLPHALTSR